jgi:hypothetical protein
MDEIKRENLLRRGKLLDGDGLMSLRTRLARALIRRSFARAELKRLRRGKRDEALRQVMSTVKELLPDDVHPADARMIVRDMVNGLTDDERAVTVRDVYFDPVSGVGIVRRNGKRTRRDDPV